MITKYANWLSELSSKKRYTYCVFLGALLGLTSPPLYIIPLAFFAFSSFLVIIHAQQSKLCSFLTGWFFGLGYFTISLYWIAHSLLIEPEKFAWLIPFSVLGLPAVISFYIGFITLILNAVRVNLIARILLFSILWVVFEILRGLLSAGFPWSLIGYMFTFSNEFIQFASITGVFGLSFVAVLIAAIPAMLAYRSFNIKAFAIISIVVIIGTLWLFGSNRLSNAKTEYVEGVNLRLVQPSIPQRETWSDFGKRQSINKHITLSRTEGFEDVTHVIWSEAGVSYPIFEGAEIANFLRDAIPENGRLLTGAVRIKGDEVNYSIWNSLFVINHLGEIESYYDKHHLVPFGEYVPFRSVLPIEKITFGMVDFSEGEGLGSIKVKDTPEFTPLICYEAIFPGKVVADSTSPKWMLNITNDAWFGNSIGPYQHFNMVRLRSVEEGIPLVRVANNGISAVIDSYGRVVKSLGLNEVGVIDSQLPTNLPNKTIYSLYRNKIVTLVVFFIALLSFFVAKCKYFNKFTPS